MGFERHSLLEYLVYGGPYEFLALIAMLLVAGLLVVRLLLIILLGRSPFNLHFARLASYGGVLLGLISILFEADYIMDMLTYVVPPGDLFHPHPDIASMWIMIFTWLTITIATIQLYSEVIANKQTPNNKGCI